MGGMEGDLKRQNVKARDGILRPGVRDPLNKYLKLQTFPGSDQTLHPSPKIR